MMQSIRNNAIGVLLLALWGLLLSACENKEDPKALSKDEWTAPALETAGLPATIVLDSAGQEDLLTFRWTPASLGVLVPVDYTLLLGRSGSATRVKIDLSKAQTLGFSNVDSLQITEKTLNTAMLSLGIPAGQATKVEMVVMAMFSGLPDQLISQSVEVTITPWDDPNVLFKKLYLVGDFNDGNDNDSNTFLDLESDLTGTYSGYYFLKNDVTPPTGGGEFKILTVLGDLESQWGDDGNQEGLSGKLKAKAGGPDPAAIQVSQLGFYEIFVNWKTKTYQLTPMTWGVIGSATPGGWDKDTNMTFDFTTRTYSVIIDMKEGAWKLRFNGKWGNEPEGLDIGPAGGGDFQVENAGKYTITLTYKEDIPINPFNYTGGYDVKITPTATTPSP